MIIKDTESVDIDTSTGPMRTYLFRPVTEGRYPGLLLFLEIFQVTGPIRRVEAMLYLCSAGLGRIAMIATLLTGYVLALSGAETIEGFDRHQPGARLTPTHTYGGG